MKITNEYWVMRRKTALMILFFAYALGLVSGSALSTILMLRIMLDGSSS